MRKKLFTLLLALVTSAGSLFAESGTCGDNLTWDLTYGVLTISGTGPMTDYTYDTYAPWYNYKSSITSVVIGDGLTSIGDYAFYECSGLTSVTIPNSVTSIGGSAFSGCTGLTSVTIPNSVTSIGDYAFYYCSGLTSVEIPNSVTSIGEGAFAHCYGLTSVTIRSNAIMKKAYKSDNNLKYIFGLQVTEYIIGDDVTSIGDYAFYECSGLTSVTIPNSVTSIGDDAFGLCSGLTSVTIPNSVTSIGEAAFGACSGLTSVTIPNSVTSIAKGTFSDCTGLTSVTIPNSVTSMGEYVFFDCQSLSTVTIPNSITNIGKSAFHFCWSLTSIEIPNSVTSIGDLAFYSCGLTSVSIPNSVTSIGNSAFSGCNNLTSVIIGNSVTSIGSDVFQWCDDLTSIQWNATNCVDFTTTSTPFYYYERNATPYNFDIRSQITSFVFGDEVEYIPAYLCTGMNNANIIIENCKTDIGYHALDNCTYTIEGTYNITLPDTVLCYDEELIIDGIRCDLPNTSYKSQLWTRNLQSVKGCDSIVSISVFWKKLPDFIITKKDEFDIKNSGSISYMIDQSVNYDGEYYYTLNGIRNASLSNLSAGNYCLVFYSEECGDSIVENITIYQYGMQVNGMYYILDENNNTATLTYRGTSYDEYSGEYSGNITIPNFITFDGKEYQVTGINSSAFSGCSNISTITMESETPISMYSSGLSSNCIIYVPYGSLNAYKSASGWRNYTIHVINPSHVTTTTGATSATITLGNTNEAQHIASCGMEGGAEEFAGNVIEYIGLEPNSEYANIPLFIKTKEGDLDNTAVSFRTTALELTTKASKPVSSTTAILLAETNMSDAEVSCGFEWKRENAPDAMEGTKVFCPVASGQMAGRLKNLRDDTYYKYRAFYQSAAGNMYYGDWQYIFTGDATVEFDPILYTYGASVVTENEATVSGYALAGSEDFDDQGLECWAESRVNVQRDQVPSTNGAPRRMVAGLNEHFFVPASGIKMTVTLTDLDEGTVYKYRVYGKVGDQYYYGTEQTFTTKGVYEEESPTSIEEVPSDPQSGIKAQKILHNGQIFILRGEKTYTIDGCQVR